MLVNSLYKTKIMTSTQLSPNNTKYDSILNQCDGTIVKRSVSLRSASYARIGGIAAYCCYPSNLQSLLVLINTLRRENLSFRILGNTTNVLFLDSVEYSCLIFTKLINEVQFNSDAVVASAGCDVTDFCRDLAMRGYTGAEGLEGIPGTIGGAIMMNAGAYGYTISRFLKWIKVLTHDGIVKELERADLVFHNRSAPSLQRCIVLSCGFNFSKGDPLQIEKNMRIFHISRHRSQEWVYPNLGSIFVVPDLNIHGGAMNSLRVMSLLKYYLVLSLVRLWDWMPNFILRRAFPTFNPQVRLLRYFLKGAYASSLCSNCTPNTFVNKDVSALQVLKHILDVKRLCGPNLRIENEVIQDAVLKVTEKKLLARHQNLLHEIYDET